MHFRDRSGLHGLALLAALAACSPAAAPRTDQAARALPPVVATFEGDYDPATGKLSFRTVSASEGLDVQALLSQTVWQDGATGSGPNDTIEMVTDSAAWGSCPVGGAQSFDGTITLRSFFLNQTLTNVHVELTDVTPAGYEACNSDTYAPLNGFFGLWSYGTLATRGATGSSATRTWQFKYPGSQRFTFQGRVMADVSAPVYATNFDWTPASILTPTHSFHEVATTTAHLVWNGTSFVDTKGLIFPQPVGTVPPSTQVGLWYKRQHRVGPFSGTSFFIADTAHGADAVDTSGDFIVCVKFRPGAHPPPGSPASADKVIVAKGYVGNTDGWALKQGAGDYFLAYQAAPNPATSPAFIDNRSLYPSLTPELFTFDYICGGRAGAQALATAHGWMGGTPDGAMTTPASIAGLPLLIGANVNGSQPQIDGAVYEIIFDSRPATLAHMNDIVDAAEGRYLASGAYYQPAFVDGTTVTGADGQSHVLPPFATVPLPNDGTGLLPAGAVVEYRKPLSTDTSATGFCIGVELTATGAWSAASGGLLDFGSTVSPPFWAGIGQPGGLVTYQFSANNGLAVGVPGSDLWAAGSTHVFKTCVPTTGNMQYYADGAAIPGASFAVTPPISNLGEAAVLAIGRNYLVPSNLTGARIGRVFACPTSVAASCN